MNDTITILVRRERGGSTHCTERSFPEEHWDAMPPEVRVQMIQRVQREMDNLTEAARTRPFGPHFVCPVCGGRFCLQDTAATTTGTILLDTVHCQDAFSVGCRWHGVWPLLPVHTPPPPTIRDDLI